MVTQKEHEKLLKDCTFVASKFRINDLDDVKDILQDCYISSLEKRVINTPAYIYISFRNRCIDEYRKKNSSVYMNKVDLNELASIPSDTKIDVDLSELNTIEVASLILNCLDKDFYLHIPLTHKNMFKDYFDNKKSYSTIAKENKKNKTEVFKTIGNLTNYACLIVVGKFYLKVFKLVDNKKTYKIMQHTIRKQEYIKYAECITSAHFGYHFNFDLFKEACKEMLFVELAPMDKHNKEKLKQAAVKLFTELYRVDEVIQTVIEEPIKLEQNDNKDTTTDKPKRVSSKSNKKSLRQD